MKCKVPSNENGIFIGLLNICANQMDSDFGRWKRGCNSRIIMDIEAIGIVTALYVIGDI